MLMDLLVKVQIAGIVGVGEKYFLGSGHNKYLLPNIIIFCRAKNT